jgi:hypothetical protein
MMPITSSDGGPLRLMQRRGRRPIGGLSSPVPERMEDTAETSY